jgi:hypothetical protein
MNDPFNTKSVEVTEKLVAAAIEWSDAEYVNYLVNGVPAEYSHTVEAARANLRKAVKEYREAMKR